MTLRPLASSAPPMRAGAGTLLGAMWAVGLLVGLAGGAR